jgi:hypothetical protein
MLELSLAEARQIPMIHRGLATTLGSTPQAATRSRLSDRGEITCNYESIKLQGTRQDFSTRGLRASLKFRRVFSSLNAPQDTEDV